MTESHVEATEGSRGPRRWRYLIDIIVLLAVTFLLDAVLGAFVQVPIDLKTGFRRDLGKFKDVQGNPELAFVAVLYALIGAGLYEEFTFRGFLMQSLAMLFGGSRGAWI